MKILFISSVMNPNDLSKRSGPSIAGNKIQVGIMSRMRERLGDDFSVITQIPISTYPKEPVIRIKKSNIGITDDLTALSIGFINLPLIKQISISCNTAIEIRRWIKKNREHPMIILSYNAIPHIAVPTVSSAKKYHVKSVCLLADPPIDPLKRNPIKTFLKKIENSLSKNAIKKYDGLIVLNKKMAEDFSPKVPYLLVEGGIDIDPSKMNGLKNLKSSLMSVYAGALTDYSGIRNLIESFKYILSNDIHLSIYGSGPLEDYVINQTKQDSRITFMGQVSNTEMLSIQKSVDLLINPRVIDDPVSQYTFPSKIMEYLASGTPTITTRINGLPEDYLEHLFLFSNDDAISIAKGLEDIASMDRSELKAKAISARTFIIRNKSWKAQEERIYDFLLGILNK